MCSISNANRKFEDGFGTMESFILRITCGIHIFFFEDRTWFWPHYDPHENWKSLMNYVLERRAKYKTATTIWGKPFAFSQYVYQDSRLLAPVLLPTLLNQFKVCFGQIKMHSTLESDPDPPGRKQTYHQKREAKRLLF